jgi:transposase InsO family protein
MADDGVVCSLSRSSNVWDNAAMESFFSSLKTERTAQKMHQTGDEARADVFDASTIPSASILRLDKPDRVPIEGRFRSGAC